MMENDMSWHTTAVVYWGNPTNDGGVLMVKDADKPEPRFPKLPGGRREGRKVNGERTWVEHSPRVTLIRELKEELLGFDFSDYALEKMQRDPLYEAKITLRRPHYFMAWSLKMNEEELKSLEPGHEVEEIVRLTHAEMKYEVLGNGVILPQDPRAANHTPPRDLFSSHEMALYAFYVAMAKRHGDDDFIRHLQGQIRNQSLPMEKAEAVSGLLREAGFGLY